MFHGTLSMLLFSPLSGLRSARPAFCCLSCLDLCKANDIIVTQQLLVLVLKPDLCLHGTQFLKVLPQLYHELLSLLCSQSILLRVSTSHLLTRYAV